MPMNPTRARYRKLTLARWFSLLMAGIALIWTGLAVLTGATPGLVLIACLSVVTAFSFFVWANNERDRL